MNGRKRTLSRREIIAGASGLALSGAIRPVMAQTPSGAPIKTGQTLSLTGPFAQTGPQDRQRLLSPPAQQERRPDRTAGAIRPL